MDMAVDARQDAPIDTKAFRTAMGCYATGVTVVTTLNSDGHPVGLTVNSFNSVSLEPALVLWSLSRTSDSLSVFNENNTFAVNVLSADQLALCQRFASKMDDRFHGVDWTPGLNGVPVLSGSVASFECKTVQRIPGGDHEIMLGQVHRVASSDLPALVYRQGSFGQLTPT
ncbi:MAG: flavin reductase family protein [Burkholderiaceae bacterium]